MVSHESKIQIFYKGPCLLHPLSLSHCVPYSNHAGLLASPETPQGPPVLGPLTLLFPLPGMPFSLMTSDHYSGFTKMSLPQSLPWPPCLKCPFHQPLSITLLFLFFIKESSHLQRMMPLSTIISDYFVYLLVCLLAASPQNTSSVRAGTCYSIRSS